MGRHQSKPEVLAATIDKINEMIAAREWEVLDSYFLSLDPWEMSPEIMIAWVRTSYPVRIKLKNWKWFLKFVSGPGRKVSWIISLIFRLTLWSSSIPVAFYGG